MSNILTTIPKKRKRRVTVRFVGTYIPMNQADYLTLYCNAFQIPKIKVIKGLLTKWEERTTSVYPSEDLEKIIAQDCVQAWTSSTKESFPKFLTQIRKELKKKKLNQEVIGRILILIENDSTTKK